MAPRVMVRERTQQKLYRSHKDKVISGVCGGLGDYFDVDSVIFRVLFVVLTFVNGIGLLLYVILWVVVPFREGGSSVHIHESARSDRGSTYSNVSTATPEVAQKRSVGRIIIATIVILIGTVALLSNLFSVNLLRFEIMWPIFLVLIGLYLIFKEE